jgi:hypothetical protein
MEDDTRQIEALRNYIFSDYGFRSPYIFKGLDKILRSATECEYSDYLKNILSGTVNDLHQSLLSGLRDGKFSSLDITLLMKAMRSEKLYYDEIFGGLRVNNGVKECMLRYPHDRFSKGEILYRLREMKLSHHIIGVDDFIDAISNLKRERAWNIFLGIACILGVPLGSLIVGAVLGAIPATIIHKIVEAIVGFSFKNFETIYLTCCSAFAVAGAALGIIIFSVDYFKNDVKDCINMFKELSNEGKFFREQKDIERRCCEVENSSFCDRRLADDRQPLLCRGKYGEVTNSDGFESVDLDSSESYDI